MSKREKEVSSSQPAEVVSGEVMDSESDAALAQVLGERVFGQPHGSELVPSERAREVVIVDKPQKPGPVLRTARIVEDSIRGIPGNMRHRLGEGWARRRMIRRIGYDPVEADRLHRTVSPIDELSENMVYGGLLVTAVGVGVTFLDKAEEVAQELSGMPITDEVAGVTAITIGISIFRKGVKQMSDREKLRKNAGIK